MNFANSNFNHEPFNSNWKPINYPILQKTFIPLNVKQHFTYLHLVTDFISCTWTVDCKTLPVGVQRRCAGIGKCTLPARHMSAHCSHCAVVRTAVNLRRPASSVHPPSTADRQTTSRLNDAPRPRKNPRDEQQWILGERRRPAVRRRWNSGRGRNTGRRSRRFLMSRFDILCEEVLRLLRL